MDPLKGPLYHILKFTGMNKSKEMLYIGYYMYNIYTTKILLSLNGALIST